MALPHTAHRPAKTLAEGAVCFGSAALILMAVAVGAQWLLRFLL